MRPESEDDSRSPSALWQSAHLVLLHQIPRAEVAHHIHVQAHGMALNLAYGAYLRVRVSTAATHLALSPEDIPSPLPLSLLFWGEGMVWWCAWGQPLFFVKIRMGSARPLVCVSVTMSHAESPVRHAPFETCAEERRHPNPVFFRNRARSSSRRSSSTSAPVPQRSSERPPRTCTSRCGRRHV